MADGGVDGRFDDLLAANRSFSETHDLADRDGVARAGVAIVTCMDARIDPLAMTGLSAGDAVVVRNPGGRVNGEALAALVLAVGLLGVVRILVVQHTDCAVGSSDPATIGHRLSVALGTDASSVDIPTIDDQVATLTHDVALLRDHPFVPGTVSVGGFVYDVRTGRLRPMV